MSSDDRLILKVLGRLNEAQARLYVAKEAICKGHGGVQRMHRLTGLSRATIARGISELRQAEPADAAEGIQQLPDGIRQSLVFRSAKKTLKKACGLQLKG